MSEIDPERRLWLRRALLALPLIGLGAGLGTLGPATPAFADDDDDDDDDDDRRGRRRWRNRRSRRRDDDDDDDD